MRRDRFLPALLFVLCAILHVSPAHAKRIIYIQNDRLMTYGEGHYTDNSANGDVFVRESQRGTLGGAWGQIASGDELIICCHGSPGSITVEGTDRAGFRRDTDEQGKGTGIARQTPYPLERLTVNNVTIRLLSCRGGVVPQVPQGNTAVSVGGTLAALLNGTGNTVTASNNDVRYTMDPVWPPTNSTAAQQTATLNCLLAAAAGAGFQGDNRVNDWLRSMRFPNQRTIVNQTTAACRTAGDNDVVDMVLTYAQPQRPQEVPFAARPALPSAGPDPPAIDQESSCDCPTCTPAVPIVSPGMIAALAVLLSAAAAITVRRNLRSTG